MAVGDDEFTVLRKTMRDLEQVQRRLATGEREHRTVALAQLTEDVRLVRDRCFDRVKELGREMDLGRKP